MESEAVLNCEGYNKEGACDMLCSVRYTVNPDSMTQVLSHARKNHVCGCATYAWVECSVYTLRRLQRNRH